MAQRGSPIIGGPLDGLTATHADFHAGSRVQYFHMKFEYIINTGYQVGDVLSPGGKYGQYADEYVPFNRASRNHKAPYKSIWLHKTMLP